MFGKYHPTYVAQLLANLSLLHRSTSGDAFAHAASAEVATGIEKTMMMTAMIMMVMKFADGGGCGASSAAASADAATGMERNMMSL